MLRAGFLDFSAAPANMSDSERNWVHVLLFAAESDPYINTMSYCS